MGSLRGTAMTLFAVMEGARLFMEAALKLSEIAKRVQLERRESLTETEWKEVKDAKECVDCEMKKAVLVADLNGGGMKDPNPPQVHPIPPKTAEGQAGLPSPQGAPANTHTGLAPQTSHSPQNPQDPHVPPSPQGPQSPAVPASPQLRGAVNTSAPPREGTPAVPGSGSFLPK